MWLTTITLCMCSIAHAQVQDSCTLVIHGKVYDPSSGASLEFASVYIKEVDKGSITGENGIYYIEGLCPGTYTVMSSHIGCTTVTDTIKLSTSMVVDFELAHHEHDIGSVTVIGERDEYRSLQNSITLKDEDLDKGKGQNLGKTLEGITGVTTLQTGASISKPVIQGLHSNRIVVMNNGLRQESQQWGTEHAPEIDPFIANQVTVIKGASSVQYGSDAIGGVILVKPKPLRKSPGLEGEMNLAGFSNGLQGVASAMIGGNHEKTGAFSWRLQGTAKRGGNVRAPNYHITNTGIKEYNFSATAGWLKELYGITVYYSQFNNQIGIFTGSHIGNLTDLELAFQSDTPLVSSGFSYALGRPRQSISHSLLKAEVYWRTGEVGKLNWSFGRQYNNREEFDRDVSRNDSIAALELPALQFDITTYTSNLNWEHKWGKGSKGVVGISYMHQVNTWSGSFFIPNFRNNGFGIFAIEKWRHKKLELEAGIRFDYERLEVFIWESNSLLEPTFNFKNVSASLGSTYELLPQLHFSLNLGNAWRPPNVNELFSDGLHHGAASIEVGDRTLGVERAYNIIPSLWYHSKNEQWDIELSYYFRYIDNYIFLSPQQPPALTIRGAFPVFSFQQADTRFHGIDASMGYQFWKGFSWKAQYSMLRAYNTTADNWLINMPADRISNTIRYDFNDGEKQKGGFVAFSVQNVLEQTRVPEGQDFVPPPDAYFLLNFDAGISVKWGKQRIDFGLTLSNLLNNTYRDYLNRYRYFADEMGTNVAFRIKIPFEIDLHKH